MCFTFISVYPNDKQQQNKKIQKTKKNRKFAYTNPVALSIFHPNTYLFNINSKVKDEKKTGLSMQMSNEIYLKKQQQFVFSFFWLTEEEILLLNISNEVKFNIWRGEEEEERKNEQ